VSRDRRRVEPFFAAGEGDAARRLLLLSPHFPPGTAAGALRWQKLARHAADRGFGLDVLAYAPAELERPDASRLAELPKGTRVFGVPRRPLALERAEKRALAVRDALRARPRAGPPGAGADLAAGAPRAVAQAQADAAASSRRPWVRAYDAAMEYARHGRWARDAATLAGRIHEPGVHVAVVSCGPPHMVHEGGRLAAERCRLPLVVDMRDPWRLTDRLTDDVDSPLWHRLAARYEPRVVARADLVVMNTPQARDAMRAAYPARAARIVAVLNGWDEEPALPPAAPDGRFLVAFVGTVYLDRDPRPFFRAAARVVRELRLDPRAFGIEFLGHVDAPRGVSCTALAAAEGLAPYFAARPPAPRREALALMARATLLLNLPQGLPKAIPSKVYEYMTSPAWVLALAEAGSATAWVMREAGADVVAPGDVDGIAAVLRERIEQHRRGTRPVPLARDARFSRRAQAGRLFDALERVLAGAPPA